MSPKAGEGEGQGKESKRRTEPPPSPASRSRSRTSPYLNVVVLGAGHHQVVLAGGLGDRQAHHRADVASQLADRLEPVGEERTSWGGGGVGVGSGGDPGVGLGVHPGVIRQPGDYPPSEQDGDPGTSRLQPGAAPGVPRPCPGPSPTC